MEIKETKLWQSMSRRKRRLLSVIAPKYITKRMYEKGYGKKLDYNHPTDFNQKLQCLKLSTYYNNATITQCVDKYRVREYMKEKKMDSLLPKLYGAYDRANDIAWEELPDSFVIKCNHGCGYNILCPHKAELDMKEAVKKINRWMKEDFWKEYCEPQYKHIKKKIIIEEHLGVNIATYKIYCFNGKPRVLYVAMLGAKGEQDYYMDFFDTDWNYLPYTMEGHHHYPKKFERPEKLDEMLDVAKCLSKDFPFVRVDLYNVDEKIYLSELTFIPTGGFMRLQPDDFAEEWGNWLDINR